MTRILHISDVHLHHGLSRVEWHRFINKRLVGLANLALHRTHLFADAMSKLGALAEFAQEQQIDFCICTGDYTALGTESELALAQKVIEPLVANVPLGLATVPGNHDIYLSDSLKNRWFEQYFGQFLITELPEYAIEGTWPWVRFPTDELAVVGVNSAHPNPSITRSSGRIPDAQLRALQQMLEDQRLAGRFVIIATHHAPRLNNGCPDSVRHGLENADRFLDVCSFAERGIVVHGHVHRRYHVHVPECSLELFCAGSTTHSGREGLWVFDVNRTKKIATPGFWEQDHYALDLDQTVEL